MFNIRDLYRKLFCLYHFYKHKEQDIREWPCLWRKHGEGFYLPQGGTYRPSLVLEKTDLALMKNKVPKKNIPRLKDTHLSNLQIPLVPTYMLIIYYTVFLLCR
jgi:hypothetical protein